VSTLRRLRSVSWCSKGDLETWAQKPPFSHLESMGIMDSELSRDDFQRLFAMLKRSCQHIRFLAISTDSSEFEAGFARVFSGVPLSVQHLMLEFDCCYFLDYAAADDAAGIFNLLRPFVPSTTQLHILDKNPWNILSGIDFLRETFDTSRFVSSMAQAESVRP
jgi:hypothetical protein